MNNEDKTILVPHELTEIKRILVRRVTEALIERSSKNNESLGNILSDSNVEYSTQVFFEKKILRSQWSPYFPNDKDMQKLFKFLGLKKDKVFKLFFKEKERMILARKETYKTCNSKLNLTPEISKNCLENELYGVNSRIVKTRKGF